MTQPMNFAAFQAHLDGLGLFHMDLSLDRMRTFAERHGPTRFQVLHVVGTNGKGSTSTILAELLRAHGLRVGLYTSPHFLSVRERIRVDGAMLDEAAWARLGSEALRQTQDLGLTYFELLTVLAVLAFEDADLQVAVMEAGLGGRYDATSVLAPALTIFTPIGLDHQAILGDTVAKIAADKAGAMRPGGLALSARQEPEAWAELSAQAANLGSELLAVEDLLHYSRKDGSVQPGASGRQLVRPMTGLALGLRGRHQAQNARLALGAFLLWASRLKLPVSESACREAFAQAFIPGRMQLVEGEPSLILDGGHNAHGLAALARSLEADSIRSQALIFTCLRDKPLEAMLPLVLDLTDGPADPILVPGLPGCERAYAPEELAALIGPRAVPLPDVGAALERLAGQSGPVLLCGSLYLLAEFYTLRPWLLEPGA